MLRINFISDTLRTLQALPTKHARQVARKIEQLAVDPKSLPGQELRGQDGFFRLKSGEYRIIYRVIGAELQIWLIGKRNDDEVYKRFARKT